MTTRAQRSYKTLYILFLVGKTEDNYTYKTTSRKAPNWLKQEAKNFDKFINDDNTVPSDVAMAMYLAAKHPRDNIECMLGEDVQSKKILDSYDVVFVIYDAIEIFHGDCGGKTCPLQRKRLERALKTTMAFVYPYPKFHKYIIVKPSYYADLQRAGLPVAPFFKITPSTALKSISNFRKRIERKGWKGVIVKPSYAGYSLGIKVYKSFSRTSDKTLRKNFQYLQKHGFPSATIQEFIPSFGKHFEIRTYWLNGKYAYSIGTLTKKVTGSVDGLTVDEEDTFVSEGGYIPNRVKKRLQVIGKQVQKALYQYPLKHPLLRIDFGCCLATRRCEQDTYFINEVETMAANMLADHSNFPIVQKAADVLYSFAKKVRGKKEPKGHKSLYKAKKIPCVVP